MEAKEFIYKKYPHLTHPLEGSNPVVDFELDNLCEWFDEYAEIKCQEKQKHIDYAEKVAYKTSTDNAMLIGKNTELVHKLEKCKYSIEMAAGYLSKPFNEISAEEYNQLIELFKTLNT